MISYLDLTGASGAAYRFARIENATPPTAHSGLYLYVREADGQPPVVLFLGETENLMTGSAGRWAEAQANHGATALFTRLHVGAAARRAELADILTIATPVMNPPLEIAPAPAPEPEPEPRPEPQRSPKAAAEPQADAAPLADMDIPAPPKA
jgi:hypothetical protein